jgi:methylated-DNA-[protein]-cysteine S-methyltransferase
MKSYTSIIVTPIGKIGITTKHDQLIQLSWITDNTPIAPPEDAINIHIERELNHYFNNPQYIFQVEYELTGTPFQKKVWEALCTIPSGTTHSYGELAKQLQSSPRAIGQACRVNPIPIVVPCHRIVAKQHLGGYAGERDGSMMTVKTALLRHEGCIN